jgi:hypothetical protein
MPKKFYNIGPCSITAVNCFIVQGLFVLVPFKEQRHDMYCNELKCRSSGLVCNQSVVSEMPRRNSPGATTLGKMTLGIMTLSTT